MIINHKPYCLLKNAKYNVAVLFSLLLLVTMLVIILPDVETSVMVTFLLK
uniref:Unnamed protein product n=1 Tax=Macaca fascicularis TaxID=9541 RepID=Q9N049_MACFA|nr:unnamed protein product [Macaca fascicularis]